jgi:RNA polymerase sigma-70 factor, ECF subfamily
VNVMRVHPLSAADTANQSISVLASDLRLAGTGDMRAFERVYMATSAKVYGIIVRIVGRGDIADEVLQEVFVILWQRAAEFDPSVGSPITWLSTIARNRALDVIRRKAPRTTLLDCSEALNIQSGDDPFSDLARDDDRRRLRAGLEHLSAEQRCIILMAYCHGMTRHEIALQTGRPVATIKTWLRRSLAELKELLALQHVPSDMLHGSTPAVVLTGHIGRPTSVEKVNRSRKVRRRKR